MHFPEQGPTLDLDDEKDMYDDLRLDFSLAQENPQDEAHQDIPLQDQFVQEAEDCGFSICVKKEIPPLTDEEMA